MKGLEPNLYECLAATFRQQYPKDRLTIYFCVADRRDPALPVLQQLVHDFPKFKAQILVEEEDPKLQDGPHNVNLGPNPKIRNMSRAYRKVKGDIVWIIDCNVWVSRVACGRMVDKIEGRQGDYPYKFVHLLPLVVEAVGSSPTDSPQATSGHANGSTQMQAISTSTSSHEVRSTRVNQSSIWRNGGGRLEEAFMSSAHAKFYTAINTVLIAPCIVGKSTMFRRSHLDELTRGQGIDFFSENICEDHLIGDLLWKKEMSQERRGVRFNKHGLVFGDLAIQPMAGMSVGEYIARRVRWLRVRKYTVSLATFVEPGTESFLCSLYGAFAFMTFIHSYSPWSEAHPSMVFASFWITSVVLWALIDWTLYIKLHSAASIDVDEDTPAFARAPKTALKRPFRVWVLSWLGREALALPIWIMAVFGGGTVVWRGKRLWVGMDMKVHDMDTPSELGRLNGGNGSKSKKRLD